MGRTRNGARSARVIAASGVLVALLLGLADPAAAAPGDKTWDKRYNGPANSFDSAQYVATSPDGAMVVTIGDSYNSSNADFVTLANDAATGAVLWKKRYNGPADGNDFPIAVTISPDSSMVVVAGRSDGATSGDFFVIAYDSKGNTLWKVRYDGPAGGFDIATAAQFTPDGTMLLVAGSVTTSTGKDFVTTAYDSATGHRLWIRRYSGPSGATGGGGMANVLSVAADGSTVVVSGEASGSNTDIVTVAYAVATGKPLWVRRFDGTGNGYDAPYEIATTPDNKVAILCGESEGPLGNADFITVAYDLSSGTKLWQRRNAGPGKDYDGCYDLVISPDSATVVTAGESFVATTDFTTIAYDVATGIQKWIKRLDGPGKGNDIASGVAITPDGKFVVLAGVSANSADDDVFTISYETTTGNPSWSSFYDGAAHGNDGADDIAMMPDGLHVAVAGDVAGATAGDIVTLAFEV
jgi:hypothetical protein